MFDPTRIDYGQVAKVAQEGSPLLLQAIGRLYGLGPSERSAFGQNGSGVPVWAWVTIAVGVGFVAGARVQKRWPRRVPKLIAGD
jgi:hypothetical protein